MMILAVILGIAAALVFVGFVGGLSLFFGWVVSSISNDNDYGVRK